VGILRLLFKISSLAGTRAINVSFSVLLVFVFYLLAKIISPKTAKIKTLQFLFFPLLFVFFLLVYTDVFSLLLIMLSLYFLMKNHYQISGFFGFLAVISRQNNIIWLGFFCAYVFLEKYRLSPKKGLKRNLLKWLKDCWVFAVVLLLICVFIAINKGVTLGDREMQPLVLRSENLFLTLFLFCFLFLPLNLINLPRVIVMLKKRARIVSLVLITFFFYFSFFKVDHWWNNPTFNYFLRNRLVNWAVANPINKIIFFLPIGYAALSLFVTKLAKDSYFAFYPFTVLFLSLSWLIEPRYSLIPFSLFILFKKEQSQFIEYLTIIIYIVLTGFLFWGTLGRKFFL
jgi:hypothetical protein